jgi:hypothetical protein
LTGAGRLESTRVERALGLKSGGFNEAMQASPRAPAGGE